MHTNEDFVKFVTEHFNSMNFNHEELIKLFMKEHPTLQQNFMRFVFQLIEHMADARFVDGRNMASKENCSEIVSLFEKQGKRLSALPFV